MEKGTLPEDHLAQPTVKPSSAEEANKTSVGKQESAPGSTKPSLPKRVWAKIGLDRMTLELMFKGAAAPTIAIAIYQSPAIASIYTTIGYLIAIMSIVSMPIMPRAKFVLTMIMNVIGICIGACFALLAVYCSTQARAHTTQKPPTTQQGGPAPGAQVVEYNASASAVSAIWLIANIYIVNTLRATRPQLQLPVIMYSIFAMVSCTYAPSFPTMQSGTVFVKRLLEAFLLGLGIAFGVSFVIFPKSCRGILFLQTTGLVKVIQGVLGAQKAYIQSLESEDIFMSAESREVPNGEGGKHNKRHLFHKSKPKMVPMSPAAARLKMMMQKAGELQGKIYADLSFAKRELAYGKLDAEDIDKFHKRLQEVLLPLYGMASVADIFSRVAKQRGWTGEGAERGVSPDEDLDPVTKEERIAHWNQVMKGLHEPFELMTSAMVEGLQHVLFVLEFETPPKPKNSKKQSGTTNGADSAPDDVEEDAGVIKPGDDKFAAHIRKRIDDFYSRRKSTLDAFVGQEQSDEEQGAIATPLQALRVARREAEAGVKGNSATHRRAQRQLYMILYMEFLLWSTGQAVLQLVAFADERVTQGVMKKRRIINPGGKRLKKWLLSAFKNDDIVPTEHTPDASESGSAGIYAGASFESRRDPEHLPPANNFERATGVFRLIAKFFSSSASAFGFRVAAATFTLGILAYLRSTQTFFRNQRIVWAMIMVAIGMTPTAGAGIFGFVGRILGTVIAMCTSLIAWYIVVGHTAGVIVFLFLFMFIEFYFLLKQPKIVVITILSIVTQVLIIGYELQVQQLGVQKSVSTGQPFYPTSELAPYRLACVAGGMVVAFIWTFFPYPMTERSQLRKDLGASLHLLANYYSIIHTSIDLRIQGKEGDPESHDSPAHKLGKARRAVWDKELALISSLRQHAAWSAWEPTFGGRFPKEIYDDMIEKNFNIVSYLALMSYASITFARVNKANESTQGDDTSPENKAVWIADFARLTRAIAPTTQAYTSTLALLSGALRNGHPLPPYLFLPEGYELSRRLEAMDSDVLSMRHVQEPGYAAFAVMQVASSLVRDDLLILVEHTKSLVGETDFSFHIHSTAQSSEETLWDKVKDKDKDQQSSTTGEDKSGKQD